MIVKLGPEIEVAELTVITGASGAEEQSSEGVGVDIGDGEGVIVGIDGLTGCTMEAWRVTVQMYFRFLRTHL